MYGKENKTKPKKVLSGGYKPVELHHSPMLRGHDGGRWRGVPRVGSFYCRWWDLYQKRTRSQLIPSPLVSCLQKGVTSIRNCPSWQKRRKREFLHIAPLHLCWFLIQELPHPWICLSSQDNSLWWSFQCLCWQQALCVNQAAVLPWRCSTRQVLQDGEDHARSAAGSLMLVAAEESLLCAVTLFLQDAVCVTCRWMF